MKIIIQQHTKREMDMSYSQHEGMPENFLTIGYKMTGSDGKEYGDYMTMPNIHLDKLREELNKYESSFPE